MSETSDKIVELKNVSLSLDNQIILEDINFTLKEKDYLTIMGSNGGGKTTILKIILGLIRPNNGCVSVFGTNPCQSTYAGKFIGYLPQHIKSDLKFPINVFDVVLIGRYNGLFKRYSEEDKQKVIEALEIVGMENFKDRQIGKLSGGQMQRVFLARALVRNPKLLLLDEPTASADPEMQQSFYKLIKVLNEKMAIVIVTHDVSAVLQYGKSVACVNRKLYYHGEKEGALGKLQDAYKCPIDLIAHGVPHRTLQEHKYL
ncbi:MAG: ABC transporter ATP-binding protein [Candidatus Altiarchaeum hamiconexum]|uniref:ABC transporter ATP-binding protein n=1 Tax=Candidatus Altarchaeum hamiconexum TaxID=1803513 RepID=A0A8J7YST2_9ARCH|nr:ABC transporter ATP-binding protein [Candidatus Altarchaeum hamiconexum]OIQ06057.1 MAG: ABC transporter [Candidatus Altarchaeum sp. CG2_30_32_3053]PIN67597.1 MAG: ABC transporter [Candidatus Altarchaeum sp. CG12_big_fil_rev_8_21_14_0_65_33_22]PIV27657.1 MAG: ABC transporter [Candidatus Altarchaeum sp. CG03_land_8_20_14_0_80_32_618]PIZ29600.1 MAG: ABC transporter [Candidatus Altarchaeum sp. CG_4_10_14_0_8_um_filter_32_851]